MSLRRLRHRCVAFPVQLHAIDRAVGGIQRHRGVLKTWKSPSRASRRWETHSAPIFCGTKLKSLPYTSLHHSKLLSDVGFQGCQVLA
jgi:hypothetical protein